MDPLESRVARVEEALCSIERRIAMLEGAPHTERTAPRAIEEPSEEPSFDFTLIGKSVLIVGGAYLLRALTEVGFVPQRAGVVLAFLYALAWIAIADRALGRGRRSVALFDAATYQDLRRLPELYCGFLRRPSRGPTAYPVACSPQAWAAAAPFAMLGACLGLQLPARDNELRLVDPILPAFIESMTLRGLSLGSSRFDLALQRHGYDVTMNVVRGEPSGDARIMLVKSL